MKLPPPPRAVLRKPDRGPWLGWYSIFALVVLIVALLASLIVFGRFALTRFGTPIEAKVTGRNLIRSMKGSDQYTVGYSYVRNGIELFSSERVTREEYWNLDTGSLLRVKVFFGGSAIDRPLRSALTSPESRVFVIPIEFGIFAVIAVWFGIVVPMRRRNLVIRGTESVATVLVKHIDPARGGVNYRLVYAFSLPNGRDRKANMSVTAMDFARAREGDDEVMLFNPRRRKQTILYAFAEYVVVGRDVGTY